MADNNKTICKNIYKNNDIDTRRKRLVLILSEIINTQLKTDKNL